MAKSLEALYQDRYESNVQAARVAETLLKALIDAEGINYLDVAGRAKTPRSFLKKALRPDTDGKPKYANPIGEIKDQVALRVITYIPEDVTRVCNVIKEQFVIEESEDKGELTRARGSFGYASQHFLVKLNRHRARLVENACLAHLTFEIQVRTVVQHAWAEFEHDIRYKQATAIPDELRAKFDRSFLLAAALLEKADEEFSTIDKLVRLIDQQVEIPTDPEPSEPDQTRTPRQADQSTAGDPGGQTKINPPPRVDGTPGPQVDQKRTHLESTDLRRLLSRLYPDATHSRADHYRWITKVLRRLNITTVADLEQVLSTVDSDSVARAMNHAMAPGHVRRLDDDLLAALGERYLQVSIEGADSGNREAIIRARLGKLRKANIVPR